MRSTFKLFEAQTPRSKLTLAGHACLVLPAEVARHPLQYRMKDQAEPQLTARVHSHSPNDHGINNMADPPSFASDEIPRTNPPTTDNAVAHPVYGGGQTTESPARRSFGPNIARHTLGIIFLLITVLLWTASNFLASVRYRSLTTVAKRIY